MRGGGFCANGVTILTLSYQQYYNIYIYMMIGSSVTSSCNKAPPNFRNRRIAIRRELETGTINMMGW